MKGLSWRAFISALLESISERLMICKDDEGPAFDHIAEVFNDFINCQELPVVRAEHLLSGADLMAVERQGLPSVRNTLL